MSASTTPGETGGTPADPTAASGVSRHTATVLAEEEARRAAADESSSEVLFADDLLPGVGGEEMSFREGLAKGGVATFLVLLVLNSLDELENAAITVLAPDIRDAFGISDGVIVFIASASQAFFVLGALPMGYLADRFKRPPIIGISSLIFGGMVLLSGLAVNAFMLFWTRFGVGIAKANTIPVHGSLIADTYPIGVRGRIGAANILTGRVIGVLSPVVVGGIASAAGGVDDEGWRWAYYLLGLPVAVFAIAAFFLREPPRGQWEKHDVLGELIEDADALPSSLEAGFERLWRIRTMRNVVIGFSAMGFGLFTGAVLANLHMEQVYGLEDALDRGFAVTAGGLGVAVTAPFVGRYFDRVYRVNPAKALALVGTLIMPAAILIPIQYAMPNVAGFVAFNIAVQVCLFSAFAMVGPLIQAIVPYRLRGLGSAMATMYIFFVGAVGGSLLGGLLADAYTPRVAMTVLSVPSMAIGGFIMLNSARFIRNDLSLIVEELREELDEHERRAEGTTPPVIQVNNVDFSYGQVQVLFDVAFEVRDGETLALLGTNGAGKSTILRVISGLATPQRGVVRLDGRTVTYTSPELRAELGIHQLPGGKGVFPTMTVHDNLRMGAWVYRHDRADMARRIERVLELFPELAGRLDQRAGSMSGGQQQMLALARVLLHEPRVLIIDELSLGLAPVVVQDLLTTVERLKADGQTMIIVEQSLNVALAIADRAIFMEKGQVRFEGPAAELAERDDLARAVFLGGEGG